MARIGIRQFKVEVIVGLRFNVAMPLYSGILRYVREHPGWQTKLVSAYSDRVQFPGGEAEPDGFLSLCDANDFELDQRLRSLKKPKVTFFGDIPHAIVPTVALDEPAIGRAAAGHLLTRGFAAFAYCGSDAAWSRGRAEGFCQAVVEAGIPTPDLMRGAGVDGFPILKELTASKLLRWLKRLTRPIGVMAHNDDLGIAVISAALSLGLRIPGQIAIVGVDDDQVKCESAPVALSSVDPDLPSVGYRSAEILDALLEGRAPPTAPPTVSPLGVKARASTEVLAFADPEVRHAVRFIRDHACEGIKVSDVANR
ncbi:MAG TPA: substrate-binding domain-containing protein, partial [Tepidisphaeraceae bacterium]|nr:substrate-binding domain-containing protein [Tepidisphaeraceae bacterium]